MIGQTVSHYRILEKLGGGGMSVVYNAKGLPTVPAALTLPLANTKGRLTGKLDGAIDTLLFRKENSCEMSALDGTGEPF